MFHWICPECGCEIPPAVKECQRCEPAGEAPVQTLVEQPVPDPVPMVAGPPLVSLSVTPVPESIPRPIAEIAAVESGNPPTLPTQAELPFLADEEVTTPPQPESRGESPVAVAPAAIDEPAPPPVLSLVEASPVALLAAPASTEAPEPPAAVPEAEPQSAPALPLATARQVAAKDYTIPAMALPSPWVFREKPRVQAPGHLPYLPAEWESAPLQQVLLRRVRRPDPARLPAAPHQFVHHPWPAGAVSLPAKSTVAEPSVRPEGVRKYSAAARASLKPADFGPRLRKSVGNPRVTLPGPSLPLQLTSLAHAGLAVVPGHLRNRGKRSASGWLLSIGLTVSLAAFGIGVASSFSSNSTANAEPPPAAAPAAPSSPLAGLVEVTGFRLIADPNKRPEIHYLVVNHSAAILGGVTAYVTLRTADAAPGQPAFARFSFRVPDLAAYDSKEMVSPVERFPRTLALPDWRDLRAEIEIAE